MLPGTDAKIRGVIARGLPAVELRLCALLQVPPGAPRTSWGGWEPPLQETPKSSSRGGANSHLNRPQKVPGLRVADSRKKGAKNVNRA